VNNGIKILVGTAIGTGVGVAASKLLEMQAGVELEVTGPDGVARVVGDVEPRPGIVDQIKARLEAVRVAGEEAKIAREAELRDIFREKVKDPTAMTADSAALHRNQS
jgi:hypothetical protein